MGACGPRSLQATVAFFGRRVCGNAPEELQKIQVAAAERAAEAAARAAAPVAEAVDDDLDMFA